MVDKSLDMNSAESLVFSDEPASSPTSWPAAATGNEWWESSQVVTSISSINFLLIIVSAAANSIVIVLFCVSRTLRKPQNLFTLNLALSDLLVVVFSGAVQVSIFKTGRPEPDPVVCVAVAIVLTSSCTCAIGCIAMIAFLRYLGIVRTGLQARLCRWTLVVPFCVGCWLLNFIILGILVVTDELQAVRKPVTRQCTFDFTYNRIYNGVSALIIIAHVLTVAGAYVSIYRFVQQSKARVKGHTTTTTTNNNEARSLRQEMRMVAPMLAIFLCFCGSWTSYFVVDVFLDPTELHHPWSHVLTQFILLLNTIADPVICVVFNHVYRDQLQRLLQRCTGHQQGTARGGLSRGVRTLDTITRGHNMLTAAVSIAAVEVTTVS